MFLYIWPNGTVQQCDDQEEPILFGSDDYFIIDQEKSDLVDAQYEVRKHFSGATLDQVISELVYYYEPGHSML